MAVPAPDEASRWRCTACGNLTRFDVLRTLKVQDFVHADLAGEPQIEERSIRSDTVERVVCRWCNAVDQVELVPRPGNEA